MGDVMIAMHQPNYLPWLGFFYKVAQSEIFILLDTVQFARRGYTHRVYLMGTQGTPHWLTQSVKKRDVADQIIHDTQFSEMHWVSKHLKTLEHVYHKSPYFRPVYDLLVAQLCRGETRLSLLNGGLIQAIATALGLRARIAYASEFPIGQCETASERIARLAVHVGASRYLSGAGARAYNEPQVYARHGVDLVYHDYENAPYSQSYPSARSEFVPGLSIVDALFNVGFDGVAELLSPAAQSSVRAGVGTTFLSPTFSIAYGE